MTQAHAQRLVAKLAGRRRSGEGDCQLVRRHERRLFVFALLAACILVPVVAVDFFLFGRDILAPLIWVAVASFQVYLWLRCRQVRRLLEHDHAA